MTPPVPAARRTVVVCDDSPHLREAVTALLHDLGRFHVVGQAVDGDSSLQVLAATRPDIMILDVRMPGGGATLVRAARAARPVMRIVMHSGHSDPMVQQEMLDAGADAYVIKSGRLLRLIQALDGPAHVPSEPDKEIRKIGHTAHFFPDNSSWTAEFIRYARAALTGDGKLMVAANSPHRAALQAALPDTLALASDQGRALIYPAEQTMERLIPRGRIDTGYFQHELRPTVEEFITGPGDVSFWGEMVGLIWATGNVAGAMELEALWNEMAPRSALRIKCPYPVTSNRPAVADLAAVRRAHNQTYGLLAS